MNKDQIEQEMYIVAQALENKTVAWTPELADYIVQLYADYDTVSDSVTRHSPCWNLWGRINLTPEYVFDIHSKIRQSYLSLVNKREKQIARYGLECLAQSQLNLSIGDICEVKTLLFLHDNMAKFYPHGIENFQSKSIQVPKGQFIEYLGNDSLLEGEMPCKFSIWHWNNRIVYGWFRQPDYIEDLLQKKA